MPPEASFAAPPPRWAVVPQAWRVPLLRLALAWAALALLTRAEWAEMARQWWNASTYNHILLIPAIVAWLVRLRAPGLARLSPQGWWPGLAWFGLGLLAWTVGRAEGVNLIAQLGAVMLLQASVAALLGARAAAALLFPLGYMLFLVPFGDEIVPPLQAITAYIAVSLLHASGVAAQLDGVFIHTPAGLFEVAEACSGVKFLVAMVALGALAAHLGFASWKRRAIFMLAAVAVPVLANGVRAWGTIYLAQFLGVAFAAGFDHIVYGWIFFAVVMAALLAVAWRYFDRSPDASPIDAAALEASELLAALERFRLGGWRALGLIALLALLSTALVDRILLLT
jgi:exosortase A